MVSSSVKSDHTVADSSPGSYSFALLCNYQYTFCVSKSRHKQSCQYTLLVFLHTLPETYNYCAGYGPESVESDHSPDERSPPPKAGPPPSSHQPRTSSTSKKRNPATSASADSDNSASAGRASATDSASDTAAVEPSKSVCSDVQRKHPVTCRKALLKQATAFLYTGISMSTWCIQLSLTWVQA